MNILREDATALSILYNFSIKKVLFSYDIKIFIIQNVLNNFFDKYSIANYPKKEIEMHRILFFNPDVRVLFCKKKMPHHSPQL